MTDDGFTYSRVEQFFWKGHRESQCTRALLYIFDPARELPWTT